MRRTPQPTRRDSGLVRRQFGPLVDYFSRAGFFCCICATFGNSHAVNRHQPTMTIHELHQEIRERRALARHAKRRGLKIARIWHVQLALNARAELRYYATR